MQQKVQTSLKKERVSSKKCCTIVVFFCENISMLSFSLNKFSLNY